MGFGVVVDDRAKLPHGVTDSTAALKYDFSAFSGLLFSGAGSIMSARRPDRPAKAFLVFQVDVDVRVFSATYLGKALAAYCARLLK